MFYPYSRGGAPSSARAITPRQKRGRTPAGTSLSPQDMADIMAGAAFLSCGGGGPKVLGQQLLGVIGSNPVAMIGVDDVGDADFVVVSAYLGSPAAAAQLQSPTFDSLERAVRALESSSGQRVSAIVPGEMGAVNSIAPILAALDLGLPVVDADGCGRAVPILGGTTFGLVSSLVSTYGAAIANDAASAALYQSSVVNAPNISLAQGALGALVASPAYGDLGAVALWLMQGSDLKQQAVPTGLSRALLLGRSLRAATRDYLNVLVDALAQVGLPARPLLGGAALTPVSFTMATVGTHDVGTLVLSNPATGDRLTVYAINENIYAYDASNAVPVSMCPDMLGWLGTDGSTFDNSELQAAVAGGTAKPLYAVGVEAAQLIGAPSLPSRIAFRESPGIQAVMLALAGGVGYAGPYVPFEA